MRQYYVSFVEIRGQTPTLRGVVAHFNAGVVSVATDRLTPNIIKGIQYDLARQVRVNSYQVVILAIIPLEADEQAEAVNKEKNLVAGGSDVTA